MNPSTIYHRPRSEFAFALDDTHYVFRLRTGRGEADSCLFYFADRATMDPVLSFSVCPMEKIRSDLYFDWYEIRLETNLERIAYYFRLTKGEEALVYYGDCYEFASIPDRGDYFQLPFNHRADRLQIPDWVQDAVVYQVFPDSFTGCGQGKHALIHAQPSTSRLGGTLRGITERLAYIASLGCNVVYLNPIFAAGAYHKYDTLDYFEIDPCFGTKAEFRQLVTRAHSLGLRVILDGVFNHMSARHPFFQDVLKKGTASPYYRWFYHLPPKPALPKPGERPAYTCFSYVASMPKTDTSFPAMRQYFCDIGTYWVREFDIDGWRLDVANEVDDGFLRAFRQAVRAVKPDAWVLGEVWENAAHYLHRDLMDSAMNYDFRRYCRRFFAEGSVDAATFDTNLTTLLFRYQEPALLAQLNLLDSHDVSRFFSLCGEDLRKMELAVVFLMTFPGVPMLYYGDELGLSGQQEEEYRCPMPWGKTHPLQGIYQALIDLRHRKPALRRGNFRTFLAEGRALGYTRTWSDSCISVFLNLGDTPISSAQRGRLLLKKGSKRGIIGAWEYEIWEETCHGGDHL